MKISADESEVRQVQVHSVGSQGMPAPAQAPAQTHAGGAADSDGARRRDGAASEHDAQELATQEPRRAVVAQAYTAAGRAVQEPEERPGISVLA
jgi:hypothetical protein